MPILPEIGIFFVEICGKSAKKLKFAENRWFLYHLCDSVEIAEKKRYSAILTFATENSI